MHRRIFANLNTPQVSRQPRRTRRRPTGLTSILVSCGLVVSGGALLGKADEAAAAQVPLAAAPNRIQLIAPQQRPVSPEGAAVATDRGPKELEKGRYSIEATPVTGAQTPQVTPAEAAAQSNAVGHGTADVETVNAVTPLCPVLAINTAYTVTGTATGGSYCYGFQITQRAKTTVFLTGQDASTNFSLTLVRHNDDDSLTVLGTSDQAGNADEGLIALTQPGLYYWLMNANASDGGAITFGAIVNTNADANELNDTVDLATTIPDGRPVFAGNMDSAQDVDYFKYVAQNGQNVVLYFNDPYGLGEWLFQYYNGSAWTTLSANQYYTLTVSAAPSTVYVRILPNPSAALNPAHTYGLTMGSQVMSSDGANAFTNENLIRINVTQPYYLTTQAHNVLYWSIRLLDSNGNPVQGVTANFRWSWDSDGVLHVSSGVSNSAGVASGQANLGDCTGPWTVKQTAPNGQTWITTYDSGGWDIKVPGTDGDNVGVGGTHFPTVSLGHICSQTFVP